MKGLMTYGGAILVLIGVAIIAVPQFIGASSNSILAAGLVVIVLGIIATIILNKIAK
jgi:hypothetical protein